MLLRRALISKRMETRLLAVAIGQVVEVVFSESVGVVSSPSAKRWADSLRKSLGLSGLAEGLAWSVGARMTGDIIQKGPFGRALRQSSTGSSALSATALLSSLFGRDGREHNTGFGEKVVSALSEMVPGIGTVMEVAMLDGNLLFHEPLHYLKQSKKVSRDVLTALPVEVGAVVLAAEAVFKGEKVRTQEPQGPHRD